VTRQGKIALPWIAVGLSLVTTSLTVTSKGQVTLRKELLAHLGIRPGQRLEVEVLPDGRLELHAAQATGEIDAVFGLLAGRTDRRASLEEIAEAAAAGWAGQ
jgi:antitoxin PrlF